MLSGNAFGDAGRRIVVEEMLQGRETSFFVLADGVTSVELASCQDYKRAEDGDRGPNTGGMGTCSPSAWLNDATRATLHATVVGPTVRGLAAEGRPFRGVLFIGVMLTEDGPKVLEYNARFGDPETQVLVPRLEGDWLALLHACARGELATMRVGWSDTASVCVVMSSGGYPGAYAKGDPIGGSRRRREAGRCDGLPRGHRTRCVRSPRDGGGARPRRHRDAVTRRARDRAYEAVACV
jgi:phosphoribosylamine--glycine ligase